MNVFIGLKLAQAWGKPEKAGRWDRTERTISFDYTSKRQTALIDKENGCIHTYPREGHIELVTHPYPRDIGNWRGQHAARGELPWDKEAAEYAALISSQPDLFPFAPAQQEWTYEGDL
jgi:hypothetical protein